MEKYKYDVGDIVRLKRLQDDNHYYIVTGVTDLSDKDNLDFDYDMYLIFPVYENHTMESMIHSELELVADYDSRDYHTLINYVLKNRDARNLSLPIKVEEIIKGISAVGTKEAVKEVKVKKSFSMSDIEDIMKDDTSQKKIDSHVEEMNNYLESLGEAIKNGDEEQIKHNKTKLEEVRQTLMELEYFQLAKRRRGTHTRVR